MAHSGTTFAAATAAAVTLLVTGCGGGGGGGSRTDTTDTATGPSVTSGAITAFGSIVVNDRRFETRGAGVRIEQDGDDAAEDDLALGMMVRVDGRGDGRRIEIDETVRGPIDSIAPPRLVVMGQNVVTGPDTVFDDTPSSELADLSPGDVVEVYGLREGGGAIRASHIERETDTDDYQVTGRVRDHDTGGRTFAIGGLTIDYQSAEVDDLPGGNWGGLVVEVEDANNTYNAGDGTLVATRVEREDDTGGRAGDDIEVERIVTAVNDDGTFEVGDGLLVRPAGARLRYGTLAELVVGVRVEVEGRLLDDGSIRATEIEFDDNSARLTGTATAVDTEAGTLTVLGVTVRVGDDVEFDDDLRSLGDLVAGRDFVEIEGRIAPGGVVIAHEIEREDDDDRDRELRGTVSSPDAAAGTLRVLGVTVTVDDSTRFEDDDDRSLSRAAFFERLVPSATVVEAQWDGATFTGTAAPVDEIELEDDDNDDRGDDRDDDDTDDDGDDD